MPRPLPPEASARLVSDPEAGLERLLEIMRRLRAPDGCAWDRRQDFRSIAPYTIEEAAEVAEAIETGDPEALRDELGDLLLQVVYHAQMAEEAGWFDFDAVARAAASKMFRRHPHVFRPDGTPAPEGATADWQAIKAAERAARGEVRDGALDGVPAGMPAASRALKLQARAAKVGFDWPEVGAVLDKMAEEARELVEARETGDAEALEGEFGDLLFVAVNLGRHLGVEPEAALRRTNAKFERRFRFIERRLAASGRTPEESDLSEMDALWDEAKAAERAVDADAAAPARPSRP